MSRWKITPDVNLYFITTTIVEWQSVFITIPLFETIIESLKFCHTNKGLRLHGYVIMPNHVHYIISTNPLERLSDIMRDFNRFTSQRITEVLKKCVGMKCSRFFFKPQKTKVVEIDTKYGKKDFIPLQLIQEISFNSS